MIEKVQIEVGEISDGVEPCRAVRLAEAGMLGRDYVEFFRKLRHAREPDAEAAAPMQKDERGARPCAHETDAAIADGEGRNGMSSHRFRSLARAAGVHRRFALLENQKHKL